MDKECQALVGICKYFSYLTPFVFFLIALTNVCAYFLLMSFEL